MKRINEYIRGRRPSASVAAAASSSGPPSIHYLYQQTTIGPEKVSFPFNRLLVNATCSEVVLGRIFF